MLQDKLGGEKPRSRPQKIVIASNNQGKIREFKGLFAPIGITVSSMAEEGLNLDIVEDGETFEENAHIKAKAVFKACGLPTIADDSGLEIDFLDGAPGVYSARYAGEEATDAEKCEKVLSELAGVERPLRNARFVCAIYFIAAQGEEYSITGTLDGFIGEEPIGENGFGYDPIFMVEEDISAAMLSSKEKNSISHRAKAFEKLEEIIKEIYDINQ